MTRLSTKVLMQNWLNILHLDKKKLLDYLKKMFSKLILMQIF